MSHKTVTLGGREYLIRPLSIKASRDWRARFTGPIEQVVGVIQTVPAQDLGNLAAWGQVLTTVKEVLLGASDIIVEALFAYSPVLMSDKERIEAEATDDEAFAAFLEVVTLAFPFGGLLRGLSRANGPQTESTSKNSPEPNGASTPTKTLTR